MSRVGLTVWQHLVCQESSNPVPQPCSAPTAYPHGWHLLTFNQQTPIVNLVYYSLEEDEASCGYCIKADNNYIAKVAPLNIFVLQWKRSPGVMWKVLNQQRINPQHTTCSALISRHTKLAHKLGTRSLKVAHLAAKRPTVSQTETVKGAYWCQVVWNTTPR